ncbi:hypothetical protein M3I01_001160 [Marinomonas sp. RSW2]|uniref:Uncharacterized protein n=1 Tax=Marinomonas maritima TaxID=2940935 RepID=A0ABT5W9N9_9GAMM|nr:hypothetical protein [Marinomonas maritima]
MILYSKRSLTNETTRREPDSFLHQKNRWYDANANSADSVDHVSVILTNEKAP